MPPDDPDFTRVLSLEEMAAHVRSGGPITDVIENYGTLNARLVMLRIALEDRLAEPRVKNYPPAVFVAYKWQDEAHNAWVQDLARHLAGRGYQVLLDRDHLEQDASNFDEVPGYIARLVECDIFLAVVTERYLDLVEARENQTSWVFDEYEVASRLYAGGQMQVVAAWKDEAVDPGKLLLRLNVVDLRHEAPGESDALDACFPVYAGPAQTDAERLGLLAFAQRFDELLAVDEPDAEALQRLLEQNAAFEPLYDYRLRLAQLYWRAGALEAAYPVALAIRDDCPNDDGVMLVAQILDAAGDHGALFRFLYEARSRFHLRDSVMYHYFAAETLFERNSVFAAVNHFRWLAGSPAFAAMPARLQETISDRIRTLEEVIGTPAADQRFHCTVCEATYLYMGDLNAVCGDCGTLYESTEARCPVCSNDGRVPLAVLAAGVPVSVACPICDDGHMALLA